MTPNILMAALTILTASVVTAVCIVTKKNDKSQPGKEDADHETD